MTDYGGFVKKKRTESAVANYATAMLPARLRPPKAASTPATKDLTPASALATRLASGLTLTLLELFTEQFPLT